MDKMILSLHVPFDKETLQKIEKAIGEPIHAFKSFDEAAPFLPDADIILLFGGLDPETLTRCPRLKWIFSFSAGVEKLPFAALMEKGVTVTNARGAQGPQIAEQTLGMMIAFSRRLNRCYRNQLERRWEPFMPADELTGKTLCIIGAGSIGREIARKAKAFDLKVIGLKYHPEALENFDQVWGIDRLHEALRQADYTVLATPLTPQTYHLIGAGELAAMKKSSFFMNISRGDTVDEPAMIEALKQGVIAGAGLDVFHEEPLPADNPLWAMENVIITPHNMGFSPRLFERLGLLLVKSIKCYRNGQPLPNQVDLERQY
jgi:phosphoglycerate dehydrogenase-like enzyme